MHVTRVSKCSDAHTDTHVGNFCFALPRSPRCACLQEWTVSELEREVDLLEDCITKGVGDAVGEVRAAARQCIVNFAIFWPERGRRYCYPPSPQPPPALK